MPESIRQLRHSYKTGARNPEQGADQILNSVLSPCLKSCSLYRRGTGAFRSSALISWVDAMEHLIKDDVRIEILTAPDLDMQTIIALKHANERERMNKLRKEANKALLALFNFRNNTDDYKNRAHLLAWLIHNEVLEIKFAFLKDFYPYPNFQEGEEGYVGAQYHTKDGYFKFDDGDIVAFSGTFNETDTGINRNIEKMNCFRSWVPEDQTRLLSTIADVDSDWMGVDNDALIVEPVTKKTLKKVKTIAPSKRPHGKRVKKKKRSTVKSNMPEIEIPKYINYKEGKWSYQGKAVKAWMENGSRGVLAMATGTGKTITSLIALSHLLVKQRTLLVVISVPSQALLKQWKKESEDFSIRPLVYERSGREKKLKNLGLLLKKQKKTLGFVLMTNDILVQEETHNMLRNLDVKKLHIGDEIHNLGRELFKQNPPDFFDYHLGLSATPKRQYDDEGTDFIFNYFGNKKGSTENQPVFEFGIDKAIEIGVLCPYDYYVHKVSLNENEMEKYAELSIKISKMSNYSSLDDYEYSSLIIQRRKILENAEGKLSVLKRLLKEQIDTISHTLIFASAKGDVANDYRADEKQLKEVNKILDTLRITRHEVTGKQSQARDQLLDIINAFLDKHIKVLTSMVVLDEGVDIPPIRQAFILSSTTIEGEWVQRRGRVLRISPETGKKKAVIHDFLVMPELSADDKDEKKILEAELKRIKAFADLAQNKWRDGGPHQQISEIERYLYG